MDENKKELIDFLKVESRRSGENYNKVYFTCHKNDTHYYDEIVSDVFKYSGNKSNIYRKKDASLLIPDSELGFLEKMSLVIVPVTDDLLRFTEDNPALREIEYAVEHDISVLPFMMEPELDDLYESSVFDKIQWVSSRIIGKDAISYEEKLKRFFDERFLEDKTIENIKEEFSSRIFFSYRKKDREYVKPLMKKIHDQDGLSDVAIWYDEYLPLAEDFSVNIDNEIDKSNAVAFLVTENLTEPGNYVKTVEYPKSKDKNKVILPLEPKNDENIRKIVKSDFESFIPGFPDCVEVEEVSEKLECDVRENTPHHKFLMGIAYQKGIDVEKDNNRALCLIREAAESDDIEAIAHLSIMYRNGYGLSRDYSEAVKWGELYRNNLVKDFGEGAYHSILAEYNIGYTYYQFEDYKKAFKSCIKAYNLLKSHDGDGELLSSVIELLTEICIKRGEYDKVADFCDELYNYVGIKKLSEHSLIAVRSNLARAYYSNRQTDEAIKIAKELYEFCKKIYGEYDYRTVSTMSDLATFYAKQEEQAVKMMGMTMQKEAYVKLCKIYEETHPAALQSKLNLATVYGRIGNPKRALKMKKEVYDICKVKYGEGNYLTLNALNNLAYSHGIMGNLDEALALKKRSYKLHVDFMGESHQNTLIACANYAYSLTISKDKKTAFELAKANRLLCEEKLGKDHISSDTLNRIYQNYKDMYK